MINTELKEKISTALKSFLGIPTEATDVEVHEKLTTASEDMRADLIVNFTNEVSTLFKSELDAAVKATSDKIEADYKSVIEQTSAQVADLQKAIEEVKANSLTKEAVENLKTEFGNELNTIKETKAQIAPGDGKIIEKHQAIEKQKPGLANWGQIGKE